MLESKILLMGRGNSGKTSMRSIIFANYKPNDTGKLGATLEVDHSQVPFLGMKFNFWDCGGQKSMMMKYFFEQAEHIFSNVSVLVYVFDITSTDKKEDFEYFQLSFKHLMQNDKKAKIFCLLHKMDLIKEENEKKKKFEDHKRRIKSIVGSKDVKYYKTSIWDESLYLCWSDIIYSLIPNASRIETKLNSFTRICGATETILLEGSTFLIISQSSGAIDQDNRTKKNEMISNIIKKFKISCLKLKTRFNSIRLDTDQFQVFLEKFVKNSFILVVSDHSIPKATTLLNIQLAKKYFKELLTTNSQ